MSGLAEIFRGAWQPLTPRGVAAFAGAAFGRLLTVAAVVALLVAISVVWFLRTAWFPAIEESMHHLPEGAEIRRAQLSWSGPSPARLGENRFLALIVDAQDANVSGRVADLELILNQHELTFRSVLGYASFNYPAAWTVSLSHTDVAAWWGAWRTPILAICAVLTLAGVFASWVTVGSLYAPLARLIAFYGERWLGWKEAWKLGVAVLLPGTVLLVVGVVAYSLGWIDLIRFGLVYVLHLVTGGVFLVVSPFFLPRRSDAPDPNNPFAAPDSESDPPPANPFERA